MISGAQPGDHRGRGGRPTVSRSSLPTGVRTAVRVWVPYVGGTPRLVVAAAGSGAITTPAWAVDGTQIAYGDQRQGGAILSRAWRAGFPASSLPAPGCIHRPSRRTAAAWPTSPETSRGRPSSNRGRSIWIVAIPGGKRFASPTAPTRTPVRSGLPTAKLLFISDLAGEKDIYRQRVARNGEPAGDPLRLTTGLGAFGLSLAGDGSRAVYSVLRLRSQVWQAPIAPARPTPLSDIHLVTRDAQAIEGLDVSRDGKWLAYDSNRGGNQDIYKVLVDGGEPIQLTNDPATGLRPQWSPTAGRSRTTRCGRGSRYRVMNAEGRDDRPVTSTPQEELYPTWGHRTGRRWPSSRSRNGENYSRSPATRAAGGPAGASSRP